MAKDRSIKFTVSAPKGLIEFELTIKVATDFRFFYSTEQLPEQIRSLPEASRSPRQYYDSFRDLKESVEKLIESFEMSFVDESKTKVILYSMDYSDDNGQAIDFRFFVLQKITSNRGKNVDVNFFEESVQSSEYHKGITLTRVETYNRFEDKYLEMAWSIEREEWFNAMAKSIQNLADQLKSGFGSRAEILARKIDQIGANYLLDGKQ